MLFKWFFAGAILGLVLGIIGLIYEIFSGRFDSSTLQTCLLGAPAFGGFGAVALRKWIFRTFWG